MKYAFDYSQVLASKDGITGTWRELYDDEQDLSENLLSILKRAVFLPHDFYNLIGAYYMLPSALCRCLPYLFMYGRSGTGKSSIAKIAFHLHGVLPSSPTDTYAGIRNTLEERRYGVADLGKDEETGLSNYKDVERNFCMVWEDIDPGILTQNPDLYRMLKVGNNRGTDVIKISGKEPGETKSFHCFCPKIFSSISPLHLDDRFRELKRRLIVIQCQRIEELSDERKAELGVTKDNWQSKYIDIDAYDWKGFSDLFDDYWDLDMAGVFAMYREVLRKSVKGLGTQQRAISIDLMACGMACGIWEDEIHALEEVKAYWKWFKAETEQQAGLITLLQDFIDRQTKNAKNGGKKLEIHTVQLRTEIDLWVAQGWLYEKPRPKEIKTIMLELGMRLQKGTWTKG